MKKLLDRFIRDEGGQDLIEYSLLAALIALGCIATMRLLATDINGFFTRLSVQLKAA